MTHGDLINESIKKTTPLQHRCDENKVVSQEHHYPSITIFYVSPLKLNKVAT